MIATTYERSLNTVVHASLVSLSNKPSSLAFIFAIISCRHPDACVSKNYITWSKKIVLHILQMWWYKQYHLNCP